MKHIYILMILLPYVAMACDSNNNERDGGNASELNGTYNYISHNEEKFCTLTDFNNCNCEADCIYKKCGGITMVWVISISELGKANSSYEARGYLTLNRYKSDCTIYRTDKCALEVNLYFSELISSDILGKGKDCSIWSSVFAYKDDTLTLQNGDNDIRVLQK